MKTIDIMKRLMRNLIDLRNRFKEDKGGLIVEYVMLVLFFMVTCTGVWVCLNATITNGLDVAIHELEGEIFVWQRSFKANREWITLKKIHLSEWMAGYHGKAGGRWGKAE